MSREEIPCRSGLEALDGLQLEYSVMHYVWCERTSRHAQLEVRVVAGLEGLLAYRNGGHGHPGQVHLDMEKPGEPSRWNTLRASRVLAHFS